jgi:anti-anti-sigma factor
MRLDPGYSIRLVRPGVIALAGEFDASNAHALQSALEDLIASGAGCVLDCGAVTYLDSSALHVLARAARVVGDDSSIIIESPGPFLTRLLEITGLGRTAHIEIRGAAPETRRT